MDHLVAAAGSHSLLELADIHPVLKLVDSLPVLLDLAGSLLPGLEFAGMPLRGLVGTLLAEPCHFISLQVSSPDTPTDILSSSHQ